MLKFSWVSLRVFKTLILWQAFKIGHMLALLSKCSGVHGITSARQWFDRSIKSYTRCKIYKRAHYVLRLHNLAKQREIIHDSTETEQSMFNGQYFDWAEDLVFHRARPKIPAEFRLWKNDYLIQISNLQLTNGKLYWIGPFFCKSKCINGPCSEVVFGTLKMLNCELSSLTPFAKRRIVQQLQT